MNTPADTSLIAEIAAGLARQAGLRFDPQRPAALQSALGRRLRDRHLPGLPAYLSHLRREPDEWQRLLEEVAVHETMFFRHAGQYRVLSEVILPKLARLRADERRLRVWSAACATGEEPYSLAIALWQMGLPADWRLEVHASDLSSRALAIAEAGVYDRRRLRALSPALTARCFQPEGGGFRLRHEIRRLVTFGQFNLVEAGPLPHRWRGMDIVFCENVLIYFLPEAVRRAVGHLRDALRPGGYLFLGFAETLYGMDEGFRAVSFGDALVYRRETVAPRPPPPAAEYSQAALELLIASGDYAGAIRLGEQWLAQAPASLPARFALARLYAAQDRDAEAAVLLRELLRHNSLHPPSYVLLGLLCFRQGELDEATAQLQHALYLEPETPLAHFYLGNIYQQRGQAARAIQAYRSAVRTAEKFEPAWDSGFTPAVLIRVSERSAIRLEKQGFGAVSA